MTGSVFDRFLSTQVIAQLFDAPSVVQAMLDFEAALARAEAAEGVIPAGAAAAITSACRVERFDLEAIVAASSSAGTLAIPLVKALTAAVERSDAAAAGYVHRGATSQDVIDTAMVLLTRKALALIDDRLAALVDALLRLARSDGASPVLGRTLLQPALVISFGFKLAGWIAPLIRARRRLRVSAASALQLQLGGAVGTLSAFEAFEASDASDASDGSGAYEAYEASEASEASGASGASGASTAFPPSAAPPASGTAASSETRGSAVARRMAADLGLRRAPAAWHTQRDEWVALGCDIGILGGSLGKIAKDWSLMSQAEVGELAEPTGDGRGGSSAMPHKRNPVASMLALAAALRTPQRVAAMLAAMPQEHERALGGWQAELAEWPGLLMSVHGAVDALATASEGLIVDHGRMRRNIDALQGLVFAEAVSTRLTAHIGKSRAHGLLEKLSRRVVDEQRHLRDVVLEACADDPLLSAALPADELDAIFKIDSVAARASVLVEAQFSAFDQEQRQLAASHPWTEPDR